jgi:hypothetical protein
MGRKVTKLHAGERLLKARYLALRTVLAQIAEDAHVGSNTETRALARGCPCAACMAYRALLADAAHGRITDDRPREERE